MVAFRCAGKIVSEAELLFALVAGDLVAHAGSFVTKSGREVTLEIWVRERDADKCEHALVSLQKSMKWDEERLGSSTTWTSTWWLR